MKIRGGTGGGVKALRKGAYIDSDLTAGSGNIGLYYYFKALKV